MYNPFNGLTSFVADAFTQNRDEDFPNGDEHEVDFGGEERPADVLMRLLTNSDDDLYSDHFPKHMFCGAQPLSLVGAVCPWNTC